ncbi:hypothetical protein NEOLEDRAFT_1182632 [Neolentinus lepideus HHB14362 ss-1]|uniref:Uncharacterized protein n=1 Tax=Neolentinus lepideus HHB14362 ss-1 TaxID=1314782 RepID=A0A165NZF3_9AGAM|nr:hypothetical protein NEOLEDRAFT_1182632 [Neolentinus lepideus HHB14362 ss-1]
MTETDLHIYQNGVEADICIQDDLLDEHHQMVGCQEGMEVEVEALVAVVAPDDGAGGVPPDGGPQEEKPQVETHQEWQRANTPAHDYEDEIIQKALRMIESVRRMASAFSLETRSFKPAISNKYDG